MAADTPVTGDPHAGGTFRKADRIRKRPHYQAVFSGSAPLFARRFVFYACPNGAGRPRLGVTVPKKMAGAVERNRVKRLLREGFRALRATLPQDCDLVANAKRSARGVTLAQVLDDLRAAAQRLGREGYPPPTPKHRP